MSTLRIGIGHDTHRLEHGGPLIVGGIEIPHDKHALGHSDADVLLHAITDAILGAAAMGDIGEMFSDTDPANRGRDSGEMLQLAYRKVIEDGYTIVNLDTIVFAQRPKLSPFKAKIKQRIAALLALDLDQVSVKAKTGESVDAVGTEQAIAAQAIVMLSKD
jgi:2-C-methyl-D-erythritol 2,4-cyclodiphosphate synthase